MTELSSNDSKEEGKLKLSPKELKDCKEAGKLKHQRIMTITTLIITTFTAILIGIIFNEKFNFPIVDRSISLWGMIIASLVVLIYQNIQLNILEELLGWKKEFGEGKLNWVAKIIDNIKNKIVENVKTIIITLLIVYVSIGALLIGIIIYRTSGIETIVYIVTSILIGFTIALVLPKEQMNNTTCEIKCLNCKKWFNSPIQFGDKKSFFTSTLIGNKAQCSNCGTMTPCNKENVRFVERKDNGRVVIFEGEDAYKKAK